MTKSNLCVAELSLSSNTQISTEGYLVLSWESDLAENSSLSLLRSADPDMDVPYTQTVPVNGNITVTGLDNGMYYFQLINPDAISESSNVVRVEVRHHSLARAFLFFSIGLLLFLILVTAIIVGEKNTRRGRMA